MYFRISQWFKWFSSIINSLTSDISKLQLKLQLQTRRGKTEPTLLLYTLKWRLMNLWIHKPVDKNTTYWYLCHATVGVISNIIFIYASKFKKKLKSGFQRKFFLFRFLFESEQICLVFLCLVKFEFTLNWTPYKLDELVSICKKEREVFRPHKVLILCHVSSMVCVYVIISKDSYFFNERFWKKSLLKVFFFPDWGTQII